MITYHTVNVTTYNTAQTRYIATAALPITCMHIDMIACPYYLPGTRESRPGRQGTRPTVPWMA